MSASRASGRRGHSRHAVAAVIALEKALLEAARRASKLRDVLAQNSRMVLHPQYVIFDTGNPRGAPASQEEVARLKHDYRRFCIFLDYPRSRCYSKFRRTWITLVPWQRDLLRCLIANAGTVLTSSRICEVVKAGIVKESELAVKKISILRAILALPGSGKDWRIIRTVSGEGYEFSGDESYCFVDYGGMCVPSAGQGFSPPLLDG